MAKTECPQMQSAFMIDLNQVSYALRNTAGPRTLIILDEFGKGTLATGLSAFLPSMFDQE